MSIWGKGWCSDLAVGEPCFTDRQCTSGLCQTDRSHWSWIQRELGNTGYCMAPGTTAASSDETGAHYGNMLVLPGTKVTLCDTPECGGEERTFRHTVSNAHRPGSWFTRNTSPAMPGKVDFIKIEVADDVTPRLSKVTGKWVRFTTDIGKDAGWDILDSQEEVSRMLEGTVGTRNMTGSEVTQILKQTQTHGAGVTATLRDPLDIAEWEVSYEYSTENERKHVGSLPSNLPGGSLGGAVHASRGDLATRLLAAGLAELMQPASKRADLSCP